MEQAHRLTCCARTRGDLVLRTMLISAHDMKPDSNQTQMVEGKALLEARIPAGWQLQSVVTR